MPTNRRFPAPWTVEDIRACFLVKDSSGQKLAAVYYEEPGRRSSAKLLTRDEARRIAANIAKLLALLRKEWRAASDWLPAPNRRRTILRGDWLSIQPVDCSRSVSRGPRHPLGYVIVDSVAGSVPAHQAGPASFQSCTSFENVPTAAAVKPGRNS